MCPPVQNVLTEAFMASTKPPNVGQGSERSVLLCGLEAWWLQTVNTCNDHRFSSNEALVVCSKRNGEFLLAAVGLSVEPKGLVSIVGTEFA